MITVTHKCDRCGATGSKDELPLTYVSIYTGTSGNQHHQTEANPHAVQWCRTCIVATGLRNPYHDEATVPPPEEPPTLEELIREIVRAEIEE